jgi:glycosyltransferase involved in cell wall biosynthesis
MNNGLPKPKILIFSLAYAPFIGGAEIAVAEITKRLAGDFFAQGGSASGGEFVFDLICARMDKKLAKKERIGNVNVYRMGFGFKNLDKYIFTFFGFFKAWGLYRKNHYQIIWPIMAAYSSFAVLFKIFTKAKVILTLQEGDPLEYITGLKRFKIFRPIYKLLYFKKVDKVQVISNFLANWVKDLGVKEEKIVVVPNGIIINLPTGKAGNQQSTINKNKEEKIILTVSRLVEKNGVGDLIRAMKFLNAKLVIVGTGELENELKNLAQKIGAAEKVEFVGSVPYENLGEYYAGADVFCRPSLSEGLGNVFLEAMAAGVPVIATPVGGIPDFLKDSGEDQTGWFCEPKNPKSIAEKIEYVLDEKNKEEVARVVNNAQKMVREKYTWEKVAEEMKGIFNSLAYV